MDEMESRLESRILMREEGTLTQEWDEKMTWSSQLRGWAQRWEAATAGAGRAVGGWGVESDPRAESLASNPPAFPPGWEGKKLFFFAFLTMARGMFVARKGIKPKSPALEGGFFTTGPPGKYQKNMFYESWVWAVFLTSKQDSKSKRDSKIGDGDPKPLSEKARQGSSPFKSTKGLSLDTSQKKNITPQDNDTLNSLFIRPK